MLRSFSNVEKRLENLGLRKENASRLRVNEKRMPCIGSNKLFPGVEYRNYQLEVLEKIDEGFLNIALVWPRRYGKDLFTWLVALTYGILKRRRLAYVAPDLKRARDIMLEGGYTDANGEYLPLVPNCSEIVVNKTTAKMRLSNGTLIDFLSAEDEDKFRGPTYHGLFGTEFNFGPTGYIDAASPSLVKVGGLTMVNTTLAYQNGSYFRLLEWEKSSEWFVSRGSVETMLKEDGSRYTTEEEVQAYRNKVQNEAKVRSEYYNEIVLDPSTHIFATEVASMHETGRVKELDFSKPSALFPVMDLGINDKTFILLIRLSKNHIEIVHEIVNNNEAWLYYFNECNSFANKQQCYIPQFILPHDANHRSSQLNGKLMTTADQFRAYGAKVQTLKRIGNKDYSVNMTKENFGRVIINSSCTQLLECLASYRKEFRDKVGIYVPVHDNASHGADSFMYAIQAWKAGYLTTNQVSISEWSL